MEQSLQETVAQSNSIEDRDSVDKWRTLPTMVDGSENNLMGGFDCNICLDCVQDPVVTFCGHLYCWPCIYKWIYYRSVTPENQPQCPVCKAEVSRESLVPLYGRGRTTKHAEGKAPHLGIVIPQRPPSPRCGAHTLITTTTSTSPRSAQQLHHRSYPQQTQPHYSDTPMLSLGDTTTNLYNPMVGMFGEMVYARFFGNPNSYHLAGSTSPRMRRQVMQADESLSRVCFFLFCCMVLCLVLF